MHAFAVMWHLRHPTTFLGPVTEVSISSTKCGPKTAPFGTRYRQYLTLLKYTSIITRKIFCFSGDTKVTKSYKSIIFFPPN